MQDTKDFRAEILNGLVEADKKIKSAEHFLSVIYKAIGDDKLFLRILENLYGASRIVISDILKVEYFYRNLILSKDPKKNLNLFFLKCSKKYGLDEQDVKVLKDLLMVGKVHLNAGVEFSGKGKAVIVDDDLERYEINFKKMKDFVDVSMKLLENTNRNFKNNF